MTSPPSPVPLGEFLAHAERRAAHLREYETFMRVDMRHNQLALERAQPFSVGAAEANMGKNNFVNIMPFDHHRMQLADGSYVNASPIVSWNNEIKYIATQGPSFTNNIADDFYEVLWSTSSPVIVMLSNENEMPNGAYWAPRTAKDLKNWDVSVIETERPHDGIIVRQLKLVRRESGEERLVRHVQFTLWKDFEAPDTIDGVIRLLEITDRVHAEQRAAGLEGPITVHCRAGVGRTGTFMAIHDHVDEILSSGAGHVDVFGKVSQLRKYRPFLVQQPQQYVFIFQALKTILQQRELI